MADVLGAAYVDIKAKTDALGPQVVKGLGDAATQGSKAATDATKNTGKQVGKQIADGIKQSRVDAALDGLVVKGGRSAEGKGAGIGSRIGARIRSGFHGARVDNQIADDVASGGKKGVDEANKSGKKIGTGFRHGFNEAGSGFKAMGAVFLANSGGVLEPLQKIQEQVSGLPAVFDKANKGVGASITKLGTIVAGVGIVGQVLGGRDVQAQAQLQASIEGTGAAYEDYKDRVEEAVKSGEKLGDTFPSTVTALNRLTIATHDPEKAFKLLTAAQDISAARHISVEQAALVVGKAVNGNTRGLRAYGITVDATSKQQSAAAALNKKAAGEATKASIDAHKARVAEQTALDKYHNLITRVTIAQTGHKASTIQVQQATLGAKKAQEALSAAVHKHGADSTAARDAQNKLAIAEERLTAVQDKGLTKAKLTVGQQQSLKAAYDAVQKAKTRVASTSDAVVSTKASVVKVQAQTKASFVDPVDAITAQANKYLGGQREASVKGFQGQLRVYGAMIEDKAAEYGQKFGKVLTLAGPALLGVGALIQTGIIGKTGSAIASVGRFGKSFVIGAKDATTGVREMSKFGAAASKIGDIGKGIGSAFSSGFQTVALKAMYAKDAILQSTAVTKAQSAVEKAAIAVKGFFVATTDAETGATKASTLSIIAQGIAQKVTAAATKVMAGAQAALNFVMDANPIVLVVAGLVALGVAFYEAYKHSKTFRDIVDAVGRALKSTFLGAIHAVENAVSAVIGFVSKHWKLLTAILTGPIGAAVVLIATHWSEIKGAAGAAFSAVKNTITGTLTKIKNAISGGLDTVVSFFTALPGRMIGALVDLQTKFYNLAGDIVQGLIDGIKKAASGAVNAVGDMASSMWKKATGIFRVNSPSLLFHGLGMSIGEGLVNGVKASTAASVQAIVNHMSSVKQAAVHVAASIPGALTGADINTIAKGGPSNADLGAASTSSARAVGPLAAANTAAKKADDAAKAHIKDIQAQITKIRQDKQLGVGAPAATVTKGGVHTTNSGSVDKARAALSNAIASQGAGSIDAQKARAALAKAEAGHTSKSSTKVDTAAVKAHNAEITKTVIGLQRQEAQDKKTELADASRLKSTSAKLKTQQDAAKSAAAAYHDALAQQAQSIQQGVQSSFTSQTGLGAAFNYHAGYGASSAAGASAALKALITQDQQFGTVLRALAKKGLNADMLQQLIAEGPQSGLAIAQQLLADPNAVTTFNDLEQQLTASITQTSAAVASSVLGVTAGPAPKPKVAKAVKANASAAGASGFAPVPAMVVHGNFVVENPTDLDKLSQLLYAQEQKTKRATGGARK